jgi:HlyD family secretion protein|tara:strand:+ start:8311 stop:9591 length:1281 start_codon:yes stop_codon:yes gene_type:complete
MAIAIIILLVAIGLFYFSNKKQNKVLKYISIALGSLGFILILANSFGWISSEETVLVSTDFSKKSNIIQTVSASGKIQPEVEVKISPDVSGEIVSLLVKEGEQVMQGDLLIMIKPDTYMSILERSRAALNTTKSNLAKSKAQLIESQANYNRNEILFNNGTISSSEFERIQSSYTIAQLNVDDSQYSVSSAQASVNEAQENLNKTNIYAPISGTISKLSVELGERVVGTAQMAGTELLRLANLNFMEVAVEVNENDINSINLNDTTIIEVDAFGEREFIGLVSEIANSANVMGASADQVTNFEVKIRIIDSVYFRPGMTATVEIQSQKVLDVISVPIQAVTTRKDTSDSSKKIECVFVYQDGIAVQNIVKTGIQDDQNIHILSGLNDSTQIVVGPYSAVSRGLQDGDRLFTEDVKGKGNAIEMEWK